MNPPLEFRTFTQDDLNAILLTIQHTYQNVSTTSDTIIAKLHEMNVSSKNKLMLTKDEVNDVLHGYALFNAIVSRQAEFFEQTIRQMAPSLQLAYCMTQMDPHPTVVGVDSATITLGVDS